MPADRIERMSALQLAMRELAQMGRLDRVHVARVSLGCSLGAAVAVADGIAAAWNEPKTESPDRMEIGL